MYSERHHLEKALLAILKESQKKEEQFILLFIELDNFKHINSALDHNIGDFVLNEVVEKIKTIAGECLIFKTGSDEFSIIIKSISNPKKIKEICQKIIHLIREAITTENDTIFMSISMGVALYKKDALTANEMMRCADIALYKAKHVGFDNCQFYDEDIAIRLEERIEMERSLQEAFHEEDLAVYFQPQYDGRDNSIRGMEALVRWIHPTKGLVPPDKFIPIAEKSDLIVRIDDYVMKKSMEQFVEWEKDGLNPGTLSLNLAMRQLNKDNFPKKLKKVSETTGFDPNKLEMEILERQVMENPEEAIAKLHAISELGVGIAIDDFGTGYSSLAYLKKLPLTKLKIDRSFIKDIPYSEDDMAICRAIIALGNSLDFKLIAEGIEEKAQVKFLLENGCNLIQGYYFSKPLNITDITTLLHTKKAEKIVLEPIKLQNNINLEYVRGVPLGGISLNNEIKIELKNGETAWVKEKVIPQLDENDNIISEVIVRYEITKEKGLEKLATTDTLTRLYNRRHFDKILSRKINNAKRENKTLAFMMIDIDNFKKYNDAYGHPMGDKVLYSVASSIKSNLKRGSDFAFRLGGEEFGVLFYIKSTQHALIFANKIRLGIDELNLAHSGSGTSDHITISAGLLVVDFKEEFIDQQGFYTMADDALYQAKSDGKDRVVLYQNDEVDFFN